MRKPNWTLILLTVIGVLGGTIVSLQTPRQFLSSGSIQFPSGLEHEEMTLLLAQALSRSTLARIIQQQDLYYLQRQHMPLEDVIERMRRDIRVEKAGTTEVRLEFAYQEPERTQKTAEAILRQFKQSNQSTVSQTTAVREVVGLRRHLAPIGWGFLFGVIAACVAAVCMRKPLGWTLRMAGSGVLGAMIALGVAYIIQSHYASTAVVRADPQLIKSVLSDKVLLDVISETNLYPGNSESNLKRLRQGLQVTPLGTTGVILRFQHKDRIKAQAAVKDILAKLRLQSWTGHNNVADLRIIDPASIPQAPVSPNRSIIILGGLCIGLLVAGIVMKRPATVPQS